jgi:hypothetical protein
MYTRLNNVRILRGHARPLYERSFFDYLEHCLGQLRVTCRLHLPMKMESDEEEEEDIMPVLMEMKMKMRLC